MGRADWLEAARTTLLAGGIDAVRVTRLAKLLSVTRGSFYWHFTSRADLLNELLSYWESTNTAPFKRALPASDKRDGAREFATIVGMWVEETDYSPRFDAAVRDWARVSTKAAEVVQRVDQRRINVLHSIFKDLGFREPEGLVRARISYFHQVGYYTLGIREQRDRRRQLAPVYGKVLSGLSVEELTQRFAALRRQRRR